jgi:hypothetical protein
MSAIPPDYPIPEKKGGAVSTQFSSPTLKQVAQENLQVPEKEADLSGKKVNSEEGITGSTKETMKAVDTVRSSLMRPILEHLSPRERNAIKNPESDMANFDMNKELLARYQTDPAFSRYIPKEFQDRDLNSLTPRECIECVLRTGTARSNILNSSVIQMRSELEKAIPSMPSTDLNRFSTNKEKAKALLDCLHKYPEECSRRLCLLFTDLELKDFHPEILKLFPELICVKFNNFQLTFIPPEIKS